MTLYEGHVFTNSATSDEALQRDACQLGKELRDLMGYDEAVYFIMNSSNLRDVVRKVEDKVAEMKACDHVWIEPITGSVKFSNGEVDADGEVGREYCPLCGMLKPEQLEVETGEELPI